jgi:hypothetical protein
MFKSDKGTMTYATPKKLMPVIRCTSQMKKKITTTTRKRMAPMLRSKTNGPLRYYTSLAHPGRGNAKERPPSGL